MNKMNIGSIISVLSADASSILTLTTELCESVEPFFFNDTAPPEIYTIAENQIRLLDEMDDLVIEA